MDSNKQSIFTGTRLMCCVQLGLSPGSEQSISLFVLTVPGIHCQRFLWAHPEGEGQVQTQHLCCEGQLLFVFSAQDLMYATHVEYNVMQCTLLIAMGK